MRVTLTVVMAMLPLLVAAGPAPRGADYPCDPPGYFVCFSDQVRVCGQDHLLHVSDDCKARGMKCVKGPQDNTVYCV